jgi:hypothetical protein
MNTIHWQSKGWFSRDIALSVGISPLGKLTFKSAWNQNATYFSKSTRLSFVQEGFWKQYVRVVRDDSTLTKIEINPFSKSVLKLTTGEGFTLASNFWGSELKWTDTAGKPVVLYIDPMFSAYRKGTMQE